MQHNIPIEWERDQDVVAPMRWPGRGQVFTVKGMKPDQISFLESGDACLRLTREQLQEIWNLLVALDIASTLPKSDEN